MPTLSSQQLKRALVDAGFIIFRTLADEVMLAERVRENLIMDAGVRVKGSPELEVRVTLRAQRGEFPGEDEAHLFARVRTLAQPALDAGFQETEQTTSHVNDPGDSTRTLDTFYEVTFGKVVADLEAALEGVRFAFALDRVARAEPRP